MSRDPEYIRLINSSRWRNLRYAILDRNPFCHDCETEGISRSASEVHHILPVEAARSRSAMERRCYDPDNLVALCHECHKRRHRELGKNGREERRKREESQVKSFRQKYFSEDPGGIFGEGGGGQ